MNDHNLLNFTLLRMGNVSLRIDTLIMIFMILIITKVVIWVIKKALSRFVSRINPGSSFALLQIIRYGLWIIAIALILDTLGIKVTLLIAGSAALLVGVGLGLQQTFNDFISGLIVLFEGTTRVGDVLEIDNEVIMIQKIGLRTSVGLTRNQITIIIPNSAITNNKVINWSHQSKRIRFHIDVGVAYGSDVELVIKTLEESVHDHPDTVDPDTTEVRFVDFGNSSLDFRIFFFSSETFFIERVKSDIRRTIYRRFGERGISIPFPQMDVHLKDPSPNHLRPHPRSGSGRDDPTAT